MIINLNLHDKKIIVIGAGKEAYKRINSLLNESCEIIVISDILSTPVKTLVKKKKIIFKKQKLENANFLSSEKPFMVITTTDNKKLNQEIIQKAKKNKIIAYSSDNPDQSDFSNPSIIKIKDVVEVAVFTGGRSPAMSKKIKDRLEKIMIKEISSEEIEQIKVQQSARKLAKEKIITQQERKTFLERVMNDKEIQQLINNNKPKKIEKRIMSILKEWV